MIELPETYVQQGGRLSDNLIEQDSNLSLSRLRRWIETRSLHGWKYLFLCGVPAVVRRALT